MQNHREALRRLFPYHHISSGEVDAVGKGRRLGSNDLPERRAAPLLLSHHRISAAERVQPLDKDLTGVFKRAISPQAMQSHRLNDGEQILYAMVKFADQQPLPLFEALALADIDHDGEHVIPSLAPDWFKPNLDRDLGTIPAPGAEVATCPHRPFARGS
jgi:hypothetical protein